MNVKARPGWIKLYEHIGNAAVVCYCYSMS